MWTGDPAIWFGRLYCHGCHAMQYFVAWEESHKSPEHAECKECGWRFPTVEETVVDPVTFVPMVRRRSTLDPEVLAKAQAEMKREFINELKMEALSHGKHLDQRLVAQFTGPSYGGPQDHRSVNRYAGQDPTDR